MQARSIANGLFIPKYWEEKEMLNKMKTFTTFLVALFALCLFVPQEAKATAWDKKTILTFAESVEVPGAILPAGKYEFVLATPDHNRYVVQVWNEDHTKLFTTFITINNYRHEATDKTVVTFAERPRGAPQAIHEWFYPGETYGKEFIYPENRAFELAAENREPVLAMPTELTPDLSAIITSPTQPEALAMENSAIVAVTPQHTEEPIAAVIGTEPATTEMASLPQTATQLSSLWMLGALCLIAAGVVRRIRMNV